jgi:NAD(P)-dependent dehydrogenase (short-subunit alcohol dehydrogenase family)
MQLAGKVALVTGASRGIGEAIARRFVEAGARVVLASRKIDPEFVTSFPPGSAFAVQAHTGKEAECVQLVRSAIAHFGAVDILVNNAATNPYAGPFLQADIGAITKTFEVNVYGYFWMTREVVAALQVRQAPGAIIHVASVAGLTAAPLQGVYAMTKAAILSMTKTLAVELAADNIRVNALAPGFVDTRFASAVTQEETRAAEVQRRTPQGRFGKPSEIADAALYLASDASSFMTGQALVIDGGMTLG